MSPPRMKAQVTFAIVPEWVLYSSISDRAVRLYCALWRHADKHQRAYPGRRRLAALLRTSLSTLDRAMQELVDVGAVTSEPRWTEKGSQRSNDYILNVTPYGAEQMTMGGASPVTMGGLTSDDGGGLTSDAQNESPSERKPVNEKKSALSDFDEFWDLYPKRHGKKVGKGETAEKWSRLSAVDRAAAMVGARHYRAACDAELTLAKDPVRFLRGRVWEDWQEPATPSSNGQGKAPAPAANADWSDEERGL